MNVPELKVLLSKHQITPSKAFGQNFLCHQPISERITALVEGQKVLEIGPGPGALTQRLAQVPGRQLVLIEKDSRFQPLLKEVVPTAELLIQDALDLEWEAYKGFTIVGNLPYHVSVPLMLAYIRHSSLLGPGLFMMQKEVAQRIVGRPSTSSYGRLSVMAQSYTQTRWVMDVPASAFWPMPGVDSAVVLFTPLCPAPDVRFCDLEKTVAQAFLNRRKMLHHNIKAPPSLWSELCIDSKRRAETLSIQEFLNLAQGLKTSHVDKT